MAEGSRRAGGLILIDIIRRVAGGQLWAAGAASGFSTVSILGSLAEGSVCPGGVGRAVDRRFRLPRQMGFLWLAAPGGLMFGEEALASLEAQVETSWPSVRYLLLDDVHPKNQNQQRHIRKANSFKQVAVDFLTGIGIS